MKAVRVLIVDDEELVCKSLSSKVGRLRLPCRFETQYATSAVDALVRSEAFCPQILITDLHMPGMTGFDLIQRMRSKSADLHILVVSGHEDFSYVRKAFVLGANDYVLKPVAIGELGSKLRSALASHCPEAMPEADGEDEAAPSRLVAAALGILREENGRLSLGELAERLHVNYAHLSKLFNEQVGCSFPAYVLKMRMENSMMYLQDPSLRITDVARKLGYADANTFSRDFKRYYGMSPKKYLQKGKP